MSNRLAHLQHVAGTEYARHRKATAEAIQAYLDCGAALIEAKAACGHGAWLPWLEGAGIPERTAQRMMKLAGEGFESDTVTDLGGIRAALEWLGTVERANTALEWINRMAVAKPTCPNGPDCDCGTWKGKCPQVKALSGITPEQLWDAMYVIQFQVCEKTPEGEDRGEHFLRYLEAESAADKARGLYGN